MNDRPIPRHRREPPPLAAAQRPRDRLGRPLPYGSPGVPPLTEDLPRSPREILLAAQNLLDEGLYFQAHEVLEAAWKAAPALERDLWRGLTQIVVGLVHVGRGNRQGAITLLRRGLAGLVPRPHTSEGPASAAATPDSTLPPGGSGRPPEPDGPPPAEPPGKADGAGSGWGRRDVDLPGVTGWADDLLRRLEAGEVPVADLRPPRLLRS
ncbi:DUF309 domain-containing protein [Parafrankia sp. EUN1f]|uniref:DUF309 domain-containing protein n=1 Tax=Parafrankia sp. EUN1f TaxID=102897 RepID=UPI0001C4748C|nr:DUF309 domain-containing protein [Parafrankia sp. EUN1f]EFC79975.1 protein of unknown function DUF309 [Parafrankia sp. EUN1f]